MRQLNTPGKHLVFAAFAATFFWCLPGLAHAETFGNDDTDPYGFASIQGTSGNPIYTNSLSGMAQTFAVTSVLEPGTMELWLASYGGSMADLLTVRLCVGFEATPTDPCTLSAYVLQEWQLDMSTLTAQDEIPPYDVPTPTEFVLDEGIILYPGVTYSIVVERYDIDPGPRPVIGMNDGQFAAGEAYGDMNSGACGDPQWRDPTALSPAGCGTTDDQDMMFRFTGLGTGSLTIDLDVNGGSIRASGQCVESDEVPEGWTLSQTVDVEYRDTSATGTWTLGQADCALGSWDAGFRAVWNAEWEVTARQLGTPRTYEASATTTIAVVGNPTPNPVDRLGLADCQAFSLVVDLDAAVGCYVGAFVNTFKQTPPIGWWFQMAEIFSATATVPLEVTFSMPGDVPDWHVYSSASNVGIVAALEDVPDVLGRDYLDLARLGLWLTFAFYVIMRGKSLFI